MKKTLLMLLSISLIIACSKDEDISKDTNNPIEQTDSTYYQLIYKVDTLYDWTSSNLMVTTKVNDTLETIHNYQYDVNSGSNSVVIYFHKDIEGFVVDYYLEQGTNIGTEISLYRTIDSLRMHHNRIHNDNHIYTQNF